uniref:Uncharacterized protein n=1 Tax=Thermus tengchongensis TaxID=1214928 RepID=A0A7V4EG60_9DEIN
MRREDHFRPFFSWLSDLEREVARRTQAVPLFSGITAQGWPYCPGVGRLTEAFRVPGGLVWWKEVGGEVRWMWQPLTPGE